jgi:Bacterial regulatory protein, Fis family
VSAPAQFEIQDLDHVVASHVLVALELHGWNLTAAAAALDIDRRTLAKMVTRYELKRRAPEPVPADGLDLDALFGEVEEHTPADRVPVVVLDEGTALGLCTLLETGRYGETLDGAALTLLRAALLGELATVEALE